MRWKATRIRALCVGLHPYINGTGPMYVSTIASVSDPFAPVPLPGEDPGVKLNEIPDPPPEENKG